MRKPVLAFLLTGCWLVCFLPLCLFRPEKTHTPEARSFMPGYWGYEHGREASPVSAGAWLTRSASGLSSTPEERLWTRFNHFGPRLHFSHNLSRIVREQDYEAHPEWFPWVGGRRFKPLPGRLNWQPDLGSQAVVDRAAELATESFLKGEQSFAVGINDALIFGESPEALRWTYPPSFFRGKPNYSNLIFNFTNRVAEKVERLLPPERAQEPWLIGCLAYYWCEQVPDFPMHANVVPFLCADRAQGYDAAFREEERALQAAWTKMGTKRLGIYDYTYGYGFVIPRIHTGLIIDHLKYARGIGFTDYFVELSSNWGLDGPQPWLVAQLLSHPESDGQVLLNEYYTRFFAESAEPMRRFFERCEELWMRQPGPVDWLKYYRNESQAELFPSDECARLRALLDQAAKLASSEKTRRRVDFVAQAFGVTEKLARFWEAKKDLSHSLAKSAPDSAVMSALGRLESAERDFQGQVSALALTQPKSLNRGAPKDFFWMSPASAAQLRLSRHSLGTPAYQTSFEPPLEGGARIAGLEFSAPLPASWMNRIEPAEGAVVRVCPEAARTGSTGLRLADNKHALLFRWQNLPKGQTQLVASVWVRGKISPAARMALQVSFLDEKGTLLPNTQGMRYIPEKWDSLGEWTQLSVRATIPEGAAWASAGLLAAYQLKGDWADFDDLELHLL